MEFKRLFWVNSSFLIIQAVASVVLAVAGFGYWSMIVGQLIGLASSVALAWGLVQWRPGLVFNWPILREMIGFSIWVMISSFQNWLFLYADNAIAGLFLGVKDLGVYSLGFNIAILIPGFLGASLGDVAYPTFCKLQENPRQVGESLLKLQAMIGTLLFPIAFGFSAIAPTAINLLYGEKWHGLGTVMAILVIMPGLGWIWSLNENAYQAIGRPDIWTKLAGFSLFALLPMLWFAAPHGLLTFTLIRFVGGWILPLGNMLIGARRLGIGLMEQVKSFASTYLFSVLMFIYVYLLAKPLSVFTGIRGWIMLFFAMSAGAIFYLTLIWILNRRLWNKLLMNFRRVLA